MHECRFIVVGGGIAGASAGWALADHGKVIVLERENQPGYHSTGRSAALFSEAYGPPTVRALATGSKAFFLEPPPDFTAHPLLSRRGAMFIGRADQETALEQTAAAGRKLVSSIHRIGAAEARKLVPVLRTEYVSGAVLEPEAMDIDVHALHYGFLRGIRARGGTVMTDAEVEALDYQQGAWRVRTPAGEFRAPLGRSSSVSRADSFCELQR